MKPYDFYGDEGRKADEVEKEFRCPHGIVFACRTKRGVYLGSPATEVCIRCWLEPRRSKR